MSKNHCDPNPFLLIRKIQQGEIMNKSAAHARTQMVLKRTSERAMAGHALVLQSWLLNLDAAHGHV
jgi:hypothetical protein